MSSADSRPAGAEVRTRRRRLLGAVTLIGSTAMLMLAVAPAGALAATADLSVDATDTPDPVTVGQQLAFTSTVTNLGPDTANGVGLVDNLPGRIDFVSTSPSQGSCHGSSKVTCNLGTIASGATATVTITVTAKKPGQVINRVEVSGADTDPVKANDSDTETTTIQPAAPLPTCFGRKATIAGTVGDDSITGTPRRDVIVTLGGNDTVVSGGGNDLVCTAGGKDTVRGEGGNDHLHTGIGGDRLRGGNGSDLLQAGGGRDRLAGGSGGDRMRGGGGHDRCNGGPGRDSKRSC